MDSGDGHWNENGHPLQTGDQRLRPCRNKAVETTKWQRPHPIRQQGEDKAKIVLPEKYY